jgi:hypothetical protein
VACQVAVRHSHVENRAWACSSANYTDPVDTAAMWPEQIMYHHLLRLRCTRLVPVCTSSRLSGKKMLFFCPMEAAFLFGSMHLQKVLFDSLTSGQHTDYRQLFTTEPRHHILTRRRLLRYHGMYMRYLTTFTLCCYVIVPTRFISEILCTMPCAVVCHTLPMLPSWQILLELVSLALESVDRKAFTRWF